MRTNDFAVFDADGHVLEDYDQIVKHFEGDARELQRLAVFSPFPSLDGWQRGYLASLSGKRKQTTTSYEVWAKMLDTLGAEGTMLYPTVGLTIGLVREAAWAAILATAYNNWVEAEYTRKDDRLFAAGIVPLQDMSAALRELQRCANDRKNLRAIALPSVKAMPRHYGDRYFWPLYEMAERLDMPLSIHGSPSSGIGLDHVDEFVKVHTLSHPIPLFIELTDMYFSGVFDAFPGLRVAFLEAGCGWVPYLVERLEYEYRSLFGAKARKRLRRSPREVICEGSQVWVSFEAGEREARHCIDVMGSERILYASDYPHEPPEDTLRHELDDFLARPDLSHDEKRNMAGRNAKRFLNIA